jgi:hypothetical protein
MYYRIIIALLLPALLSKGIIVSADDDKYIEIVGSQLKPSVSAIAYDNENKDDRNTAES